MRSNNWQVQRQASWLRLSVVAQLLTPLTYVLLGLLVDLVFEPAVRQPYWRFVAPLVGYSAGAGIGLFMVIGGTLVMCITLAFAMIPAIRMLEQEVETGSDT
jgi:hypothetical protein